MQTDLSTVVESNPSDRRQGIGRRDAGGDTTASTSDLYLSLGGDGLRMPLRDRSGDAKEVANPRSIDAIVATTELYAKLNGELVLHGDGIFRREDLAETLLAIQEIRRGRVAILAPGYEIASRKLEWLRDLGVQRLLIPIHSARQDAHDWLVARAGALKASLRVIRGAITAGISVTADVALTRPSVTHLPETISLLTTIGVRSINIRRLNVLDVDETSFVPLSPRLSLLEDFLEQAATVALGRKVRLSLRDLPLCAAPKLRPLFAKPSMEVWTDSGGIRMGRSDENTGCAGCPGAPSCSGAPRDYVARFGWEEFLDQGALALRIQESVPEALLQKSTAPLVFGWSGPRRVTCDVCADAKSLRNDSRSPEESTRAIRTRMVQAARLRPSLLRVIGTELLAHPHAALLLFDAVRLFPRVHIAGEASAISGWSDLDWRRLKDVERMDVALYGPDAASHDAHCGIPGAFDKMMQGIERMRSQTSIEVGAYAVLHDATRVLEFASAWEQGKLPGEPRFRLSSRGGSLDELVAAARALPPGKAREALLAVLPCSLVDESEFPLYERGDLPAYVEQQTIHSGRSVVYEAWGADPVGEFSACTQGTDSICRPGCPGTPLGWTKTVRSR